jgi:uncharacterized membrane protein YsdA (DUF1294 family)
MMKQRRLRFRYRPYHYGFGLLAFILAGGVFSLLYLATSWPLYLIWIASFSAATFSMFALDKLLSKRGDMRIPEAVLHLCSLLGGFPGQLLGHLLLAHKTNFSKHPQFLILFFVSLVAHGLLGYWLYSR